MELTSPLELGSKLLTMLQQQILVREFFGPRLVGPVFLPLAGVASVATSVLSVLATEGCLRLDQSENAVSVPRHVLTCSIRSACCDDDTRDIAIGTERNGMNSVQALANINWLQLMLVVLGRRRYAPSEVRCAFIAQFVAAAERAWLLSVSFGSVFGRQRTSLFAVDLRSSRFGFSLCSPAEGGASVRVYDRSCGDSDSRS
ncbi:hypothetical protein AND_004832 [Anopheles darlingi]|uniref:Uncharacterized protein n=1 Tax=Anopheles darlingi TaxID=43151 RepID=W5JHB9_ANODA|nr:hypothetical protein AND_004832 [Anopheles darlingi]